MTRLTTTNYDKCSCTSVSTVIRGELWSVVIADVDVDGFGIVFVGLGKAAASN